MQPQIIVGECGESACCCRRPPVMWQEPGDLTIALHRQSSQNVLEIGIRVVSAELGRLDQAHDCCGALAGAQAPGEQPVASAHGNYEVILPMSGKRSKSSTAGTRCTGVAHDGRAASNERRARLFTLR